jgi:hypothetical protein
VAGGGKGWLGQGWFAVDLGGLGGLFGVFGHVRKGVKRGDLGVPQIPPFDPV